MSTSYDAACPSTLLARDAFGSRMVWVGRLGEPPGSVPAVGAVGLPLVAALLTAVLIVQRVGRSRSRRESSDGTA